MQLNTGKSQFGMVGMLKDIVAKEGVGRLYKGIAAPFAMEAPKRATKCESQARVGRSSEADVVCDLVADQSLRMRSGGMCLPRNRRSR